MPGKSPDYRMWRLMCFCWFGLFLVAMFMMSHSQAQRDDARRFRAQFGEISLSCVASPALSDRSKVASHD